MSLEAALDEERREIMALLEGQKQEKRSRGSPRTVGRTASPAGAQSPIRSMLDVGPAPGSPRIRSMLDGASPPPSPLRKATSPPPTPKTGYTKLDPEHTFRFEMLPSVDSGVPKRVTQGGKKKKQDMRSNSTTGITTLGGGRAMAQAMNPNSPLRNQTRSPSPGLNNNRTNLMADPGKYVTDSGKVIDMSKAYRRMSDGALLKSGGSLSGLAKKRGSDPSKGEALAPDGGVRLQKDYYASDEDEAIASSDDSGDSDNENGDKRRGRTRSRSKGEADKKVPKSLLAAAEDERKDVAYSYSSLLEPTLTVTGPDGKKRAVKQTGVHPDNNFDQGGASGLSTPVDSDTEADITEIRRAQRLAIHMTNIQSVPEAHRCLRSIIRGEYDQFQREADAGLRKQRVYLVATDLSDEAAYALEWTIGTVLRDGDTLMAVYAVDEEEAPGSSSIAIGDGAKAVQEAASDLGKLEATQKKKERGLSGSSPAPSPLRASFTAGEQRTEPTYASMDQPAKERYAAVQEVSERIVKLLRKTKLQVRVIVEVFHCKSPKHMLIEVIDYIDPTLVVLGSRGRSALKGVLLGSFSNYLVTKSSVPVMVARKRLRKHSKYKRTNLRLSNVLTNPSSKLALAKID